MTTASKLVVITAFAFLAITVIASSQKIASRSINL